MKPITTLNSNALTSIKPRVTKKSPLPERSRQEAGFTLLETTIALVVMLIAALGAASVFSYAINYNSGGSDRLVALAIAQEQLERIRSGQFNSTTTDTFIFGGPLVNAGFV
jgi:prepilin-type N-terminal cleavage/methylation domain-containing protein